MTQMFLLASFAGFFVVVISWLIAKLGPQKGSILGTLPSTIVPSSFGYFALGENGFKEAIGAVPLAVINNVMVLACFVLLGTSRKVRSWFIPLILSLCIWFVDGYFIVVYKLVVCDLKTSFFVLFLHLLIGILLIRHVKRFFNTILKEDRNSFLKDLNLDENSLVLKAQSNTLSTYFNRFISAFIIALVGAIIAQNLSPVAGALASAFPKIFLVTITGIWRKNGPLLCAQSAASMSIGSFSIIIYALSALYFFPLHGAYVGVFLSYLCAVFLGALPVYLLVLSQKSF